MSVWRRILKLLGQLFLLALLTFLVGAGWSLWEGGLWPSTWGETADILARGRYLPIGAVLFVLWVIFKLLTAPRRLAVRLISCELTVSVAVGILLKCTEPGSPAPALCPLLFLFLVLYSLWLLHPLKDIREAVDGANAEDGVNHIVLERLAHTELYDLALTFNTMSDQNRRLRNDLEATNGSYARFVPEQMAQTLHRSDVRSLKLGDSAIVDGAVLMLLPQEPPRTAAQMEEIMNVLTGRVQEHNGLFVDHDQRTGSMTILFPGEVPARGCAWELLNGKSGGAVGVFATRLELGLFGSQKLLLPLPVSHRLRWYHMVLERAAELGAVMVYGGESGGINQRLLGRDDGTTFYEDVSFRDSAWRTRWSEASPLWDQAMECFYAGRFAGALRRFAKVLRLLPEDGAAQWYLLRCDELRDKESWDESDTELLPDWREKHGKAQAARIDASGAEDPAAGSLEAGSDLCVEVDCPAFADGAGGADRGEAGTPLVLSR